VNQINKQGEIYQIKFIIRKEIKNFWVRIAMKKWYLMMIGMNLLFVYMPYIQGIEITKNRAMFSLLMMTFTVFLVPNTLSLDLIGGEKYHKTLETIISTPISVKSLLLGKSIFILLLAAISLAGITVLDNIALTASYHTNFLDAGFDMYQLVLLYITILSAVVFITLFGSMMSLAFRNLKLNGYIVSVVNVIVMYFMFSGFQDKSSRDLLINTCAFLLVSFAVVLFVFVFLTKSFVMKYIK
jgi:ABC-type Na+ efflux pump permease subunit